MNEHIVIGNYYFFWKRNCFSQWYKRDFIYKHIKYNSMEQFMMHRKAILFHDSNKAHKILCSNKCSEMQELGRKIKNFNQEIWDRHKENIIYEGTKAKFFQNKDLLKILLNTNELIIHETCPAERIWSIGYSSDNPVVYNLQTELWGEGLLGKILMKVREELR
jgi:ribA/ribD-fused uncharacterized protein